MAVAGVSIFRHMTEARLSSFFDVTPEFAVSGQLEPGDFARAAADGFTMVINNRPDGESPDQLAAEDARVEAEAAGLAYVHAPVPHTGMQEDAIQAEVDALTAADGPVLAYCAAGGRSLAAWAIAQVTRGALSPEDAVIAAAQGGMDLRPMLPMLAARAPG